MFTASRAARVVGHSAWASTARRHIAELAAHDRCVLIVGPPSSGRTVMARAIHEHSTRRAWPFVPVRCDRLPGHLFSSQFFGCAPHENGTPRKGTLGAARAADGGTLFLARVDELDPLAQWELLGFLAHREARPVGGEGSIHTNARIVASCSPDIFDAINWGRFDADLFEALAGCVLETLDLARRVVDIAPLAEHYLHARCERLGLPAKTLAPSAVDLLISQPWPGNIGQLRSLMEGLAGDEHTTTIDHETIRVWLAQRDARSVLLR